MKKKNSFAANFLTATGLVLLLGSPAMAQTTEYRSDRISTQGRISSVTREGDMLRVTLDHGAYTYYVPASSVGNRNLTVDSRVRLGGTVAGDNVNVDVLALPGEAYYNADPRYVPMPYPMASGGWMSGEVTKVDRHLGYLDLREDNSGAVVRIDARHMDTHRPFNVWNVKTGDRISVNGKWESRGNFDAARIEY
jgi:hypothetical protein